MQLSTLSEWLSWIDQVHANEIDLGLERVKKVADKLKVLSPACPVIIVGGTNGKGSTVAGLEAIYLAANYRTGAFTSPFLFEPNEQVRINGEAVRDQELCEAFALVEETRGDIPLTQFEYFTLAALVIFKKHLLDVMILEVGLGGRLDSVNIIDASVAVVASIGIDHVSWLGTTREQIGREKAGIFRPGYPVVCGDFDPPASILEAAAGLGAPLYCQGREFNFNETISGWSWQSEAAQYSALPLNILAIQNMSSVLMVITLLQSKLPVTEDAIKKGLRSVKLPGRIQVLNGPVTTIFDVSHNPAAIGFLKQKLSEIPCTGKTHAVFSMLADKDIIASILAINDIITDWHVAPLKGKRAAAKDLLTESFVSAGVEGVTFYPAITAAYDAAAAHAKTGDRILIFGSFRTVADVWSHCYFHKD